MLLGLILPSLPTPPSLLDPPFFPLLGYLLRHSFSLFLIWKDQLHWREKTPLQCDSSLHALKGKRRARAAPALLPPPPPPPDIQSEYPIA